MSSRPFEEFSRNALRKYQAMLLERGVTPREAKQQVACAEDFAEFLLGAPLT
jgi:hypothetical protein